MQTMNVIPQSDHKHVPMVGRQEIYDCSAPLPKGLLDPVSSNKYYGEIARRPERKPNIDIMITRE